MSEKIGVLGCGWLGLPLGKHLLANSYVVYGTTTSKKKLTVLQNEGIHPYLISLSEEGIDGNIQSFLENIDILIINVPPKLRGGNPESFFEKMKQLYKEIKKSKLEKIVFVSSTSVYGDVQGEVAETTSPKPITESGKQLLESENLFKQDPELLTTIIRFGGLIGPDRHPVTFLSGKQDLSNGNDPVNLIHLEDCIHLICTIIENRYWNETFNGVYPYHPKKSDYYTAEARKRGIPVPVYQNKSANTQGKIVLSENFLAKGHGFNTAISS